MSWDKLSMSERADIIKLAVQSGIKDLYAIRDTYNEFAKGGKKKSGTNLKQNFLTSLDQSLREDATFNTPQYRQFFTDLARQESGYYPTITNSIGAKGYFQLMPGNRSASWSNTTQQFHETYKLVKSNIDYFNKKLTKKDWDRARELGIDMYGLLGGAHLGGVGGVVRALRGKGNAKDMNGSSVLGYMRQFSQSGKPTTYTQAPQVSQEASIAAPIPSTTNSDVAYNPLEVPQLTSLPPTAYTLGSLPTVEDIARQSALEPLTPEELRRQERHEKLERFQNVIGLMSRIQPSVQSSHLGNIASVLGQSNPTQYFSDGGSIHIKPENRGKFTALKERTGHSASWFKENGTPAQKKMATFALNSRHWKHGLGGNLFGMGGGNPFTVGTTIDSLYASNPKEEFLGEPDHHYDFTQSEEWADAHGYYPDARGHRDDRVKKPTHPSHPDRGTWNGDTFILSDLGMQNPNYTLFGLNDGDQDPQATLTYKGGVVLPEITVTPKENYIFNPYDNIILHQKALGGNLFEGGGIKAGIPVVYPEQGHIYEYLNNHPNESVVLNEQTVVGHAPNARQRLAKYLQEAPARDIDKVMAGYLAAGIAPVAIQAAAPGVLAASDAIGGSAAGQIANKVLTSPYFKKGLEAAFAGHGLNHAINEGIDGYGDAALTALELAPLGGLAKPVYKGVVQPGMTLFNSPLTGKWAKFGSGTREYRLNPNILGANGSLIESRKIGDYSTGIDLNKMRSIFENYEKGLTQYKGSKSPSNFEFNYEMPKIDFDNLVKDDFVDYLSQQTGRTLKRVPIKDTKHGDIYNEGFAFVDDKGKELAHIAGRRKGGKNVFVESSYVDPEFRYKGLGKQMYFDLNDHVFSNYGTTLHSDPMQRVGSTGVGMSPSNRLWKSLRDNGISTVEGEGFNRYDVMAEPSKITTAYRTPAAPQITAENAANYPSIMADAGTDFSFKGDSGLDLFTQKLYSMKIHGQDLRDFSGKTFSSDVKKGVSNKTKEEIRNNVVRRNMREFMNDGLTSSEVTPYATKVEELMDDINVGRYTQRDYEKAGWDGFGGFYDPERNFLSINEEAAAKGFPVEPHEVRHAIDHNIDDEILTPTSEIFGKDFDSDRVLSSMQRTKQKQNMILQNAYDNDFVDIPNKSGYNEGLENYSSMEREAITTNRDAREALLGSKKDWDPNITDKIIDKMPDNAIFEAVERANGYGRRFIKFLRENNKLTPKKAQQFREAMKHVGAYVAPAVSIGAGAAAEE